MSVFQFKEFLVDQKQSPAKITTDATVFAASIQTSSNFKRALEIGTGTGVLSLMLAQRFHQAQIDAVEINPVAFEESKRNFKNSKWESRLKVLLADFKQYRTNHKYDLIFSNPPFFHNNLQSQTNQGKNTAYHTNHLSFNSLATGLDQNLAEAGEVHIMLPSYEMSLFEEEMKSLGFQCTRSTALRHQVESKIIRFFNVFERGKTEIKKETAEIYLRDENNNFHPSYIKLMKDFLTIF
ncbi:tRNA1Val (adenine37-N6)-methyltransferase [Marivirga sericea]|uniref:tRNA1(Val) (adenine(37)-N6)-methyltransferase n=1 Tax=Marivirga sericea TaxID=1028 RepID=A0A1X7JXZ7_9BACT|nr:methyltransferase [Marivirga sericea]SMG33006.1 tRNA1Val (adenine37-N6)-methyltransferase [Marivirga sericea]